MGRSEGKAALPAHDFVITLPVLAVDFKAQLWEPWDTQELGLQQKVHGETSCFARGKTKKKTPKKGENMTQINPEGLKSRSERRRM